MAAKRPLRTTSFRGGKVISHGRAATLPGAVLSATRRMLDARRRIAAVEILDPKERVICEVCWSFEYHIVGDKTLITRFKKGHQKWMKA